MVVILIFSKRQGVLRDSVRSFGTLQVFVSIDLKTQISCKNHELRIQNPPGSWQTQL